MPESKNKPESRMGHSVVYDPLVRAIYLFGGSKKLKWFNDVHVLDTDEWEWKLVEVSNSSCSLPHVAIVCCLHRHRATHRHEPTTPRLFTAMSCGFSVAFTLNQTLILTAAAMSSSCTVPWSRSGTLPSSKGPSHSRALGTVFILSISR